MTTISVGFPITSNSKMYVIVIYVKYISKNNRYTYIILLIIEQKASLHALRRTTAIKHL